MNDLDENVDELEAELQTLAPAAPTPELEQRLAQAIQTEQARQPQRGRWRPWLMAIATGLLVAVGLWQFAAQHRHDVAEAKREVASVPTFELTVETNPTSWAAYRTAILESPEALDNMLDRDAAAVLPTSLPINLAQLSQ